MALAEMVADALAFAADPASLVDREQGQVALNPATSDSGLSPREVEVLRQLAEGHPDRQIADTLSISPKTVGRHISNILAKLGVTTRTAAATHAVRHNLI
jgi:DNA-binding NarL/FixJ family response regulator